MIYSVEDDAHIREMVVYALRQSGFAIEGFADAAAFWKAVQQQKPELVLLDIMLPGEDGLSVLRRLRQQPGTRHIPVLLLTAKGAEMERVQGLNEGADDYLTKPFSVLELIARVRALLRRSEREAGKTHIRTGGIELDTARHTVTVDGAPLELTLKEYDLLKYLMEHGGLALSRERLVEAVWNLSYLGGTRTVDVHIQTLRQKLGPHGHRIETVRGVGYRFAQEEGT